MTLPPHLPWLLLAGGLGALCRHLVLRFFAGRAGVRGPTRDRAPGRLGSGSYPVGTTLVNLFGASGAGLTLGLSVTGGSSPLLTVISLGFLGSLTTFSAWMLEVVALRGEGAAERAVLHLLGLPLAGVVLAAVSFLIAVSL